MIQQHMIIIGGGHAGFAMAAGLRKRDSDIMITLLTEEPNLPYQRPPLSKKYLLGDLSAERLLLRPAEWFTENNINVEVNTAVTRIDRQQQKVYAVDNRAWHYDALGLALGCRPRLLPDDWVGSAKNVCTVRTQADVDCMRPMMQAGQKLVIVGGGYIGLEAAAVARKLDMQVTLLEAAPRILGRVAATETAGYFRSLHQHHAVTIVEGCTIIGTTIDNQRLTAVQTDQGLFACDMLIVGIGIIPNTQLAEDCGLTVDQGIVVDARAATSDARIFAAGDCTRFDYNGTLIRLESVQNANDQADVVAENMLGQGAIYDPKPWFWSDQYDVSLQIAGLNMGYDNTLLRVGKKAGSQSVWYYRGDKLLAVDAMNDVPCYMVAKKVLDKGGNILKQMAQDPDIKPKDFMVF